MTPSILTTLGLGLHALSANGLSFLATILISTLNIPGSFFTTGHQFIIPDSNTTTAPAVYIRDETTPSITYPLDYGTEYCTGMTGSLLCSMHVKLTGSGGHRNHNAGSFVCSTSTCSVVSAYVFTEAIGTSGDRVYGGWTNSPGTTSGAQVFNAYIASNGATVVGSGSYVSQSGTSVQNIEKDVPPGATFKFVWSRGDGSEDYSTYKASAVLRYYKYYTP